MLKKVSRIKFIKVFSITLFIFFLIIEILPAQSTNDSSAYFYDDHFIIVKAGSEDTLASLAEKYLQNPAMKWIIARFNDIDSVKPGQEIIIPLKPFEWGGLTKNGYQTVPVLVYNRFSRSNAAKLVITETAFEEQMEYLKKSNFTVISADALLDFLNYKIQLPEKTVVITMDGGWKSQYTIAYPILKRYGYPATFFINTDFIGSKKALSWKQIGLMVKDGYDMQSMTKSNRNLVQLHKEDTLKEYLKTLEDEILIPQKVFKVKLRRKCKYIAYPAGVTNALVTELLIKYGYRGGFTLTRGSNPFFINNYTINRSIIDGDFSLAQFKENLSVFTERVLK